MRAKEHWRADGEIQKAIKEAKISADGAAVRAQVTFFFFSHWMFLSQEVRKRAIQIAATLDAMAAENLKSEASKA